MADLKAGTTVGGAAIWNASNFQVTPSGDFLTYRGYKVYTSNDKPSAEDIGALSLNNGGAIKGAVSTTATITSNNVITAAQSVSTYRAGIIRGGGESNYPYFHFINTDVITSNALPTANATIGLIQFKEGSVNSDQWGGKVRANFSTSVTTAGDTVTYLDNRDGNGNVVNRITMNTANSTTSLDKNFRVLGTTTLASLNGTTASFSGAVSAASLTPTSYSNFDSRYMSGLGKRIPVGITSMADASVTESNDVWTVADTFSDGPNGNTTYAGMLVNYRRVYSVGAALVQILYTSDTTFMRIGSGSPGAWAWKNGDANGWRKVYDSSNLPTPVDVGSLAITGGTLTGNLDIVRDNAQASLTLVNASIDTATANPTANAYIGGMAMHEKSASGAVRGKIETVITPSGNAILQTYARTKAGTNGVITQLDADAGLFKVTTGGLSVAGATTLTGALTSGAITTTSVNASGNVNAASFTSPGNVTAGSFTTGGILKYITGALAGQNNAKLFMDHGNGNVTVTGSVSSAGNAGDLMLGYNAGGGFWTRNVTLEVATIAKSTFAAQGRISTSADIVAAGAINVGNGNAYMHTDGNINGPVWGGWLSNYIYSTANERASAWANQQVNAYTTSVNVWTIGTYLTGVYMGATGGGWIGLGGLVNGSELRSATSIGSYDPNQSFAGTWMCCGRTEASQRVTTWKRVG